MEQQKTIRDNLSALESSAHRLTNYLPRQWADIQMCRMFVTWLVKRAIKKAQR